MKSIVVSALLVFSSLCPSQSLRLPTTRLFTSTAWPNQKLLKESPSPIFRRRGGALFEGNSDESVFDHLETLNDFASFRGDVYDPPLPQRRALIKNQRKIGLMLMTTGMILTVLGMMLFFEGNLLRLGNLSFLLGTSLLLGPIRIYQFFFQPKRVRSTVSLLIGIFLVFIKWSKLGILCEIFGIFNLFGNMFPLLYRLLRSLPVIGDILKAIEGNDNPASGQSYGYDDYNHRNSFAMSDI